MTDLNQRHTTDRAAPESGEVDQEATLASSVSATRVATGRQEPELNVFEAGVVATAKPSWWTLGAVRRRFQAWRRTRPFWAGLWTILGAVIITYGPATAFKIILVSGDVVWLGMLIGVLIGVLGLFLWFSPTMRHFYSVLIILLALVSLITSDLGGFLMGATLAIVGGSMGFSWTDADQFQAHRKHRLWPTVLPRRRRRVIDLSQM